MMMKLSQEDPAKFQYPSVIIDNLFSRTFFRTLTMISNILKYLKFCEILCERLQCTPTKFVGQSPFQENQNQTRPSSVT